VRFDISDIEIVAPRTGRRARTEPIAPEDLFEDDEPSIVVDLRLPVGAPVQIARGSSPRIRVAVGTTPPPRPSLSDGVPVDVIDDD
jgi:hypothetical protein